MLRGLAALLVCQLVGEIIVTIGDLKVPGPVVGMAILFVVLIVIKPDDDNPIIQASDGVLAHLPLFFVPPGVGIFTLLPVLGEQALPIGVGLFGSWAIAVIVTGWVAQLLSQRFGHLTKADAR